jgi:hypothetical protein
LKQLAGNLSSFIQQKAALEQSNSYLLLANTNALNNYNSFENVSYECDKLNINRDMTKVAEDSLRSE